MSPAPRSRLYLPKLQQPPATIFEHLVHRFPQIESDVWRSRISRGVVTLSDGTPLREDTSYRHGIFVFYRREVSAEPDPVEDAVTVYRDENLMIVDKPHGMPVTPSGPYVGRSLIIRLGRCTGLSNLAPIHRLDRDTAGLLMIAIHADVRGRYHRLFSEGVIEREYLAVANMLELPSQRYWRVANRIEAGEPWFRRRIVDGPANAVTEIELIDRREGLGLFKLIPRTGKKHQLRLHMSSIGYPIVGDSMYPEVGQNNEQPLQLLAKRLSFVDPLSFESRSFESTRRLRW